MKSFVLCAVFVLLANSVTFAVPISVDWDAPAGATGDLDGVGVTFDSGEFLFIRDLSGADFSAAPLTANTEVVDYHVKPDWTATFNQPVANLLLYAYAWRGVSGGVSPTVDYTFDQPFTILSGLGNATVSSNILSLPDSGHHSGLIRLSGPVSSLSVNTNSPGGSLISLTFGGDDATYVIPAPSPILLVAVGILGLIGMGYRQRKIVTEVCGAE